jgi:methionyl-tRNA formyltransferase
MVIDVASLPLSQPSPRGGVGFVIACSEGAIRPILVQRAGRGVMTSEELLRGFTIPAGTRL